MIAPPGIYEFNRSNNYLLSNGPLNVPRGLLDDPFHPASVDAYDLVRD
jgi:hypothetical protein